MLGRPRMYLPALVLVGTYFILAPFGIAGQKAESELASLPLAFETNQGQAPARYQFIARRSSMETFFSADGMDVVLARRAGSASVVHITWKGAEAIATLSGEEALPGHSNYLRSADPAKWLKDIPQFARIRYTDVYPNIDLVFHGRGDTLEHDFLLWPGGDVSRIVLRIDRRTRIDRSGNLIVDLGKSQLRFMRPVAYQLSGDSKTEVAANFVIVRKGEIRFKVGKYDRSKPLIIDPVFAFSTYLDGSLSDNITAVTTDATGNVYVTGYTNSTDFPITNSGSPLCTPCSDVNLITEAFISKLDSTGHTLVYSSYLGGSNATGGFGTFASSISLDKNGNIYVTGVTSSWDFPHVGAVLPLTPQFINGNYYFVSSLKPDGSAFNYSGLVGGEEGFYTDGSNGKLAVDANGNAYLAGTTYDANFQLTPGTLDSTPTSYPNDTMFVLKLDVTGKLVYSTLVPGNVTRPVGTAYADNFVTHGITVDVNGQVTAAGLAGIGLPTTPGALEATIPSPSNAVDPGSGFMLQLNATASMLNFATYLPGTDSAGGIAPDANSNFYVTGSTSQTNLPVSANAFQKTIAPGANCTCNNGYVLKINNSGTSVLAGTYLSGPPSIGNEGTSFTGIALDSKSNVLVGGMTGGSGFPLKNPYTSTLEFSSIASGLVLAEMSPDLSTLLLGSYLSSTSFLGGSRFSGLAVDPTDKVLVVGTTNATDFPTTAGSYQTTPPPSPNPLSGYAHSFVSKLDLSTPAPSVCLATTALSFGAVLVGTSSTLGLGITNCGNAALQITSVTSSLASVVPAQNCASVAVGSICDLQITFTPANVSSVQGTLTLTDNAAVPQQTVAVSGKGGIPQVFFPPSLTMSDLLVGTHAEFYLLFSNLGDGAWIVTNATATGDFRVDNQCTAPVLATNGSCTIGIIFAPTQVGLRTGILTLTDNAAGSPHVIALSGNSLSAYTTPSIAGITALAMDAQSPILQIAGTNFFPASQVLVNGSPRTTNYVDEGLLLGTLLSGDVAQAGELAITVVNPTLGGGVSNSYPAAIYNAIRNIGFLHAVYDAKSGHIYASVSTSSANYANQVVVIDPASAKVLSSWSVGNGPNQLAISDDGQFLYVGLDGDKKVAQVALPGGTINFAVGLGNEPTFNTPMVADALGVLPGQPHSWAVTLCATGYVPCGNGVAVFDDAKERATVATATQLQPDSLVFVGQDATTLYGTTLHQGPSAFYKFAISSTGITLTQTAINYGGPSPGGGTLDSDGTSIYVSNGQVIDPNTLNIKSGGFSPLPFALEMRVDVPSSRVYFVGQNLGPFPTATSGIQAYDLASQRLTGSLGMQEFPGGPEMYRWGTNGLEVGVVNGMLFFQTSLTGSSIPATQFFVSAVSPMLVPAGSPDLTVTITGGGFGSGDTVTANGVQLSISGVTASQIIATIPAPVLSVAGDVQLAVTDTDNHVGYLEMVVSPGNTNVGLSTNVLNFAAQDVGTSSSAQKITLTNNGSTALLISGVAAANGDFSQTNNCTTVAPAASCTIFVTFTPSSAGNRSGALQINDNDASKAQTVTLSGIGSDVQIAASSTGGMSETVKTGVTASYGLAITPEDGFTGTLTFSCTNLPQYASCTFNPSTATIGTAAVNVTVAISTQQQQTAALYPKGFAPAPLVGYLACVLLLPLGIGRYRKVLRRNAVVGLLVFALVLLPLAGCGGGGGSPSAPLPTTLYTPTGTYTVSFTATSGAFSHSAPLTLIVTN